MKTLLEIIVKHRTEGFKSDKITSDESDCIQSRLTINSTATSPAITSTSVNGTKTEDSTMAYVVSRHTKLRYYTSNAFDTLFCCKYLKFVLNVFGIYLFHRSDNEETCSSQPTYTSVLPETERPASHNQTGFYEERKGQAQTSSLQDNEKKTQNKESTQRSRTNRIRRGMMAGPIANTPQVLNF